MAKAKPSLLDSLRDAMSQVRHGGKRWHEKLTPEQLAELAEIKTAWLAGELGTRKKTLARAISANLAERGICNVGTHGVIAWLDEV